MNISLYKTMQMYILIVSVICVSGCDGGININIGDISGPDYVNENATVEFGISIINGTGLEYIWSIEPDNAGHFEAPNSAKTYFTANSVNNDKQVEVTVIVSTDQEGPVIKKKLITIENRYGWSKTWGRDGGNDFSHGVATDDMGNIYVAGDLAGTVDMDPGPGIDVHVADGYHDMFISKYDSEGLFIWARSWGSDGDTESIGSIAVDYNGAVYVGGSFENVVDFDPGQGVDEKTSSGGMDSFLCKYNPDGDFIWVRTWGGPNPGHPIFGYENCTGIAIDNEGSIYATGCFVNNADFDPGPGEDIIPTNGKRDAYLVKYDIDGNYYWARTWGGAGLADMGTAVHADGNGNVFVLGEFEGTCDFDPGPGIFEQASTESVDRFLSKFDKNGGFLWSVFWPSLEVMDCWPVKSDSSGSVYICGAFANTVDFDPGEGEAIYTSHLNTIYDIYPLDSYLCKLGPNGDFKWVNTWGGMDQDTCLDIFIDQSDNIYVTGWFANDLVDLNPGPGVDNHYADGVDTYLLAFDTDGYYHWGYSWGENISSFSFIVGGDLAGDYYGNIFITGYFHGVIDFDSGPGVDIHDSGLGNDIFLIKFPPDGA